MNLKKMYQRKIKDSYYYGYEDLVVAPQYEVFVGDHHLATLDSKADAVQMAKDYNDGTTHTYVVMNKIVYDSNN